jgi:quercetin dioxygenase-like cupin family protein
VSLEAHENGGSYEEQCQVSPCQGLQGVSIRCEPLQDFHAHIIKAKHLHGGHNGLHRHVVGLQFAMVLKGWVSFYYADHGEFRYEQGDAVTIPGDTLHELREYSEDLELLELTSPAVYRTVREDGSEMPTPGQKERIQERTAVAK